MKSDSIKIGQRVGFKLDIQGHIVGTIINIGYHSCKIIWDKSDWPFEYECQDGKFVNHKLFIICDPNQIMKELV